ncbi:SusD/RagB family nutrient-binding outer membrane lipoprotein [Sphingobacterium sp. MYb382]|uniref:SusD/RagB family nutrient-binding outer membrane lipoprotein n=1 Tax=Sphingobacterium sp. MYb382 TaxID=2745278 RepID=UPI0030B0B8B8
MKNTLYKIGLLSVLALTSVSCSDFFDVNTDPNRPVEENLSLNVKLPAALVASANYETTTLNQIGGLWGGYWGTSNEGVNSFTALKLYNGPAIRDSRDGVPVWENNYNTLLFYKKILNQAIEEDARYYMGISKIMMAYHFFTLVDFYNNVPFDDALNGSVFLHPTYNTGKDVYEKSINLINEGIEEIKDASLLPTSDDVLFKGDKNKWFRFANTLKLRALLTQSEVSAQADYIRAELAKIKANGAGFILEDAGVNPGYLNTQGKMNPFYENFYRNNAGVAVANHTNIRPTQYLISKYKELADTRLAQNFNAVKGDYAGVIFGENSIKTEYAAVNTSSFKGPNESSNLPAGLLKSFNQSTVMISLAEANFMLSEAATRGWVDGSADAYYKDGIQASFNYLFNVKNHNIVGYLDQEKVKLSSASNKIERIIQQKWLALSGINNIRAWNDFRRLGYPKFPNSVAAVDGNSYPLRFMYPETEINTNEKNVLAQGDNGVLTAKVWWHVR